MEGWRKRGERKGIDDEALTPNTDCNNSDLLWRCFTMEQSSHPTLVLCGHFNSVVIGRGFGITLLWCETLVVILPVRCHVLLGPRNP